MTGCGVMKCEYFRCDTGGARCTYPRAMCRYRYENDNAEIARLREEVAAAIIRAGLATGHGDTVTDMLNEMVEQVVALSKRAESAEGKVEKVRAAIDGGEEDGLAAWVIVRELKAILPPKEDK